MYQNFPDTIAKNYFKSLTPNTDIKKSLLELLKEHNYSWKNGKVAKTDITYISIDKEDMYASGNASGTNLGIAYTVRFYFIKKENKEYIFYVNSSGGYIGRFSGTSYSTEFKIYYAENEALENFIGHNIHSKSLNIISMADLHTKLKHFMGIDIPESSLLDITEIEWKRFLRSVFTANRSTTALAITNNFSIDRSAENLIFSETFFKDFRKKFKTKVKDINTIKEEDILDRLNEIFKDNISINRVYKTINKKIETEDGEFIFEEENRLSGISSISFYNELLDYVYHKSELGMTLLYMNEYDNGCNKFIETIDYKGIIKISDTTIKISPSINLEVHKYYFNESIRSLLKSKEYISKESQKTVDDIIKKEKTARSEEIERAFKSTVDKIKEHFSSFGIHISCVINNDEDILIEFITFD